MQAPPIKNDLFIGLNINPVWIKWFNQVANNISAEQLVSTTVVSLAANADTILFTVPSTQTFIPTKALLVAGANANSTDISIGQSGAETDWIGTTQCDNLDAANDVLILQPVPAATPPKTKAYASGTVIELRVTNQAGGAVNTLHLFGFLF